MTCFWYLLAAGLYALAFGIVSLIRAHSVGKPHAALGARYGHRWCCSPLAGLGVRRRVDRCETR